MTEYVFHLGDKMAGSSAIQTALAVASLRCPGQRIAYPAPINHAPLAASLSGNGHEKQRADHFAAILEPAKQGSADLVLISAETFEGVDPRVLRDAMQRHMPGHLESARFIAYVRPHAERVVSDYAAGGREGQLPETLDRQFDDTARSGVFPYTERFRKWRDTFGDRFTLRPLIRERLSGHNLVHDFLGFALRGAPFELLDAPSIEETPCVEDLVMLDMLKRRFSSEASVARAEKMHAAIVGHFASILERAPRPDKRTELTLHKSLASRLWASHAQDAATLDAEFFEGTPMSDALASAVEKAVEAPQSLLAEDYFTPQEMRILDGWTWVVTQILLANPKGWSEFFRDHDAAVLAEMRERNLQC